MRQFLVSVLALAGIAGCATAPLETSREGRLDDVSRLAIITAYEPELAVMLPRLANTEEFTVNGVSFWTGDIDGLPVVLFMTGISVVNASMNTQLLLDHFNVSDMLVSGVAGGVNPDLQVGDVTIPAHWGKYDRMVYLRETLPGEFTPPPDVDPEFSPFNFMMPRGAKVRSADDPTPDRQFWFSVDEELMEIAQNAAGDIEFKTCDEVRNACLTNTPKVITGGYGVTGAVYVDNAEFREYLFETFDAHVLEMETAAIGMVAKANGKPYIAIRSLSDLAGGGDTEFNESVIFEDLASENFALYLDRFIEVYAETRQ